MSLKVTVLGSGSAGNCTLVSSSKTNILIDLGLSAKDTALRLNSIGVAPEKIDAILITHEHSDHIKGLPAFVKCLKTPVYISELALEASGMKPSVLNTEKIQSGVQFEVGEVTATPFSTPHDSVDPFAFTIESRGVKVSMVTDIGYISGLIKERVSKSDCLIVESNHDVDMLKVGPYPWSLKQRILGRRGHLSNSALGDFLTDEFDGYARWIFLAHLSKTNNHPEIALLSAKRALDSRADLFEEFAAKLKLTHQDRPSEAVQLE